MSSDAKTYIKDVLALLEIPSKSKQEVQSILEASIAEHGLEEASYNTIAEELGEPQVQAAVYAEHFSAFDRLATRRHRKMLTIILGAIAAIIMLVAIFICTFIVLEHRDLEAYRNGYYVETISVDEAILVESDYK